MSSTCYAPLVAHDSLSVVVLPSGGRESAQI